ncbi:MAG: Spy/CpxP family protein refolding chaperone [Gemmatimonadaceae bacterium]
MNRIRMFALGALVAATVVAPLGAQSRPDTARPHRGGVAGEFGPALGRGLFRGIQLGEQEKASLEQIREKYRPQMQQLRQQMQPQMQEAMKARRAGDTAAARAAFQKTEAQRQQMQALAEKMHQESRNALTPEHRAQLDSNVARMHDRASQAGRGMAAGRGMRGQPGMRPGAGRNVRPGRPGARPARGEFRGRRGAPFAGRGMGQNLQLSDAEKASVKAIRDKYQPQFRALREEAQKDRQATRAKAEQLREQMHAEVRAALTPEQQNQLDSLEASRPARKP